MPRKPAVKQFSFAGGEISPRLFGRTDLDRYRQSLQTCRNFIVEPTGGATNRPGTKLVKEVKDSSKLVRLIPFIALNGQAYALEFGDFYMRVHTLGGTATFPTSASGTHTGNLNSPDLIDNTKVWSVDQWVGATLTNVTNGETATVTSNTVNTVVGTLSGGEDWDTDDEYTLALSNPGTFEIATPFAETELAQIKYAQQNDVMILVHPNVRPQVLSRLADNDWRMVAFSVAKNIYPPTILSVPTTLPPAAVQDTHSPAYWAWVATAIDRAGKESIASNPVLDLCARYPDLLKDNVVFDPNNNGNAPAGYNIYLSAATALKSNGYYGFIGFKEHDGDPTDQQTWRDEFDEPDYTDGPPEQRDPFEEIVQQQNPGAGNIQFFIGESPPDFQTSDASEVLGHLDEYRIAIDYQLQPGEWVEYQLFARGDAADPWVQYGDTYRVENTGASLIVGTLYPLMVVSDPNDNQTWNNPWKRWRVLITAQSATVQDFDPRYVNWTSIDTVENVVETFPAAVCFYEQRLLFGGFTHNKQLLRMSRTGDIFNFDQSEPLRADDAFDLTIASLRLDAIRQLVPTRAVAMLTAGAEWLARGAEGQPLTPTSFDLKAHTSYGASKLVQALPIGEVILYVTERGLRLREMVVDPYGDQSRSRDLSIMVEHLFRDDTVVDMQYADQPYQVVWAVREDGTLLGLTYQREHQVYAWHRHDTGGVRTDGVPRDKFEAVCCVPESNETSVYVVVQRTINGQTKRFVEQFAPRRFLSQSDAVFLDCAKTFDGRNTSAVQLRLQSITGTATNAAPSDTVLEDSGASWAADEWVGNTIKNTTQNDEGSCTTNDNDSITVDDLVGAGNGLWTAGDGYEIEPTWVAQEKMILHSDTASTFVVGDVGTEFELRRQIISGLTVTDYSIRVRVTGYIDDQNLEVTPNTAVPAQIQTVYTSDWGQAFNSFSGLDHLEGESIGVLVDGATHQDVTVTGGVITLDANIYAERLQAGIKYDSDLVTLPLDLAGDEGAVRASKKLITTIYLEVDDYRSLSAGHNLNALQTVQQRTVEEGYATVSPENVLVAVRPKSKWSRSANVAVRQSDPLPVTVQSVITAVKVGGNQ